jgi:hypothetical protein
MVQKARFRLSGKLRYRVSVAMAHDPIEKVFADRFDGWTVEVIDPEQSGLAWIVVVERSDEGGSYPPLPATRGDLENALAHASVSVKGYSRPEEMLDPDFMPSAAFRVKLFHTVPEVTPDF